MLLCRYWQYFFNMFPDSWRKQLLDLMVEGEKRKITIGFAQRDGWRQRPCSLTVCVFVLSRWMCGTGKHFNRVHFILLLLVRKRSEWCLRWFSLCNIMCLSNSGTVTQTVKITFLFYILNNAIIFGLVVVNVWKELDVLWYNLHLLSTQAPIKKGCPSLWMNEFMNINAQAD